MLVVCVSASLSVHTVCCNMLKCWPLSDRRGSGSEDREDATGGGEKGTEDDNSHLGMSLTKNLHS